MDKTNSEHQKEKEFWAWTKRPDIQEKLLRRKEGGGLRPETIEQIERELNLL